MSVRRPACCSPTGAAIPTSSLDGPGTDGVARALCEAARAGRRGEGAGLALAPGPAVVQRAAEPAPRRGDRGRRAASACSTSGCGPAGSHHQKFVVLRHPGRPELDVAFVGGIDLCHSRRDDAEHHGDPQKQPMAAVYGPRPPWHDIQLAVRGPAVADVEATFRERWDDPAPLTRNPVERAQRAAPRRRPPAGSAARAAAATRSRAGTAHVQLLRTYANRHPGYPFAPRRRAQRRPRLHQGRRRGRTA